MKKIYLRCYLNKNLGDDLFLKIISERYDNQFFCLTRTKYKNNMSLENVDLKYVNKKLMRNIDRFSKIFGKNNMLENYYINKNDIVVVIGGSIFMEMKNQNNDYLFLWYKRLKKPYYILGANIGPYYTESFLSGVNSVLNDSADTCLRDYTSYNLMKNSSNIRVASDIVFSMNVDKYIKFLEEKTVSFSLIDCSKKAGQMKNNNFLLYEDKMIELIEYFQKKCYKINLISFCEREGDEIIANKIYEKLKNKENINKVFYDDNIDEVLYALGKSSIIVGTRFHANILGLLMNKTIIPVIYNDKSENLLKDLDFKGRVIDINKIQEFDCNSLTDEDLKYKLNVDFQKKESENHFKELDKILNKKLGVK